MKKAIVEKLMIVDDKAGTNNATFTGVLYWEGDMKKAHIDCGNFQNVPEDFDRENLIVDESAIGDGSIYCLSVRKECQ